jgi:hypothetical protein
MFRNHRFWFVCALLIIMPVPSLLASADVLLKPNGQGSYPLRIKALKADARIDGQFAATRLNFTFQNETADRIEADFMYTLPANTVVTYFAYWFGEEKVVARIVEKARARAIYTHITSRMRDPALVEMVGKDTFRARIFPVMPNADLKVEMVLMQILPSDGRTILYSFPLDTGKDQSYQELDFQVAWRRGSGIERFTSNYWKDLQFDDQFARFRLKGTNFRPPKDVRVSAIRYEKLLHAELYAAPSGGGDGFFALALTSAHTLAKPLLQISGVKIFETLPTQFPEVKAGRAQYVFGRYRGSGPAMVTVTGRVNDKPVTYTQAVHFGNQSIQNNIASKLWAWRRIEQLSASDANRITVIALSKRFLLPSKFTSWLAVPKEELERYKRERIQAEMEVAASHLAREILAGRENRARARHLQAQLEQLGKQIHFDPKVVLQNHLSKDAYSIADSLAAEIQAGRKRSATARRLRATLNRICHYIGQHPDDLLRNHTRNSSYEELYRVAEILASEIQAGRGQSSTARRLRKRLHYLCYQTSQRPKDILRSSLYDVLSQLKHALYDEIQKGREKGAEARRIRARLNSLCQQAGLKTAEEIRYEIGHRLHLLSEAMLAAERGSSITRKYRPVDAKMWNTVPTPTNPNGKPDPARAAQLRQELERLARFGDLSPEEYMRASRWMWKEYDCWQVREKLLVERRKDDPDEKIIAQLEKQFIALNQELYVPEGYGETRAQLLAVRVAQEKLAVSAPGPAYIEEKKVLAHKEAELRARMGDPLIRVDAPEDAEQVIALMPDGEVKRLEFNARSRKWEARFDIPGYAKEGAYVITLLVVKKDGTRQMLTMRFHVDVTPPVGTGRAAVVTASQPTLRLELDASPDTARVVALLPWGASVSLNPSTQEPNRFFALVAVPLDHPGKAAVVTFVLTDKAHNRTTVTVNREDDHE